MLRPESRVRARALQLLYAWDLQNRPPMRDVAYRLLGVHGARGPAWDEAEALATAVAARAAALDEPIAAVVERWRPERIGIVERNILRLGLHELERGETPSRVVIDEALRLAHWFAGSKAPAFVNGVLDALARQRGRL
jgi:N utilization substance protein B